MFFDLALGLGVLCHFLRLFADFSLLAENLFKF